MHPFTHPDQSFTSGLRDPNSETFQTSNDRRRGFVSRSASIHTVSPSNPSPAPFTGSRRQTPDIINPLGGTGSGNGSNQNSTFTSSPLQNPVAVDYSVQTQGYGPNTTTDFNFNSNPNGTQAPNLWGINSIPLQSQAPALSAPPAIDFSQPDMGFDWMNWMSTANVAMGPAEEQYGTQ